MGMHAWDRNVRSCHCVDQSDTMVRKLVQRARGASCTLAFVAQQIQLAHCIGLKEEQICSRCLEQTAVSHIAARCSFMDPLMTLLEAKLLDTANFADSVIAHLIQPIKVVAWVLTFYLKALGTLCIYTPCPRWHDAFERYLEMVDLNNASKFTEIKSPNMAKFDHFFSQRIRHRFCSKDKRAFHPSDNNLFQRRYSRL